MLKNASGILAVTQCTSYNSASGNCDTSEFNIRDLTLRNWTGTTTSGVMADVQCTVPDIYLCDSVVDPSGFNCTGKPWEENP